MNGGVIVGIILVVLLGAGAFVITQNQTEERADDAMMESDDTIMQEEDSMMDDGEMESHDNAMMKDDEGAMMEEYEAMMMKGVGTYEAYTPEKLAYAEEGDVVLFFRASWCPTCRALDVDINANADAIPAGVTILDVDYDTATALKQKYGVTYQHTLVQVDADGNMITKWTGSPTLTALVSEIQ